MSSNTVTLSVLYEFYQPSWNPSSNKSHYLAETAAFKTKQTKFTHMTSCDTNSWQTPGPLGNFHWNLPDVYINKPVTLWKYCAGKHSFVCLWARCCLVCVCTVSVCAKKPSSVQTRSNQAVLKSPLNGFLSSKPSVLLKLEKNPLFKLPLTVYLFTFKLADDGWWAVHSELCNAMNSTTVSLKCSGSQSSSQTTLVEVIHARYQSNGGVRDQQHPVNLNYVLNPSVYKWNII